MARKAGRGDPIITEEKVRDYLESQSPPLAGTTQIAEQFDVARPSVIERLNTLENRDVLGKRKVGQSFAWYLTEWKEIERRHTANAQPPVNTTGNEDGSEHDGEPITDGGGLISLSDHPWLTPVITGLNISLLLSLIFSLSLLVMAPIAPYLLAQQDITPALTLLAALTTIFLVICVVFILVLEVVMYPHEAPIRQYFHHKPPRRGELET